MKYKPTIGMFLLLTCYYHGFAQQFVNAVPVRAMTNIERTMYGASNMNDLKNTYDTMKTDYERRYFLCALPNFCIDMNIQSIPAWMGNAVIAGLASKDPLCVFNAVNAAGALKISSTTELMALYNTTHSTFGCHEDMIKSAILGSICKVDSGNTTALTKKNAFLYSVLTSDSLTLLSASFSALINALTLNANASYIPKLQEYSTRLSALETKLSAEKESFFYLDRCRGLKNKITTLCNQQGGN
jgi:hypothetical protein